jgi:hypothetical protein
MVVRSQTSDNDRCSWCGTTVARGDGFRAAERPGARTAVFCRLEHVVPWAIRGAHWRAGADDAEAGAREAAACSQCGQALGDVRVQLVGHRGDHRIPDAFCSVDHLATWAKAGGRWG